MTTDTKKIRFIFWPCLIVSVSTVIIYTFLHWLLFIHFQIFPLKETVLNLFIPIVLCPLIVFTILRKQTGFIITNSTKQDPRFFFRMVVFTSMIIPMCLAQSYMITATGKLTLLSDISHITDSTPTKYYSLAKFYLNKIGRHTYSVRSYSGKGRTTLNFDIYVVLPILKDSNVARYDGVSWLAMKFHDEISNSATNDEKEEKYRQFAEDCRIKIDQGNIDEFAYLNNEGNNNDHDRYNDAIELGNIYSSKNTFVLSPVTTPFEERNGQKLLGVFSSFAICNVIMLLILSLLKVNITEAKTNSEI